jgi:flagellar basal-body rod modification protein FlgD
MIDAAVLTGTPSPSELERTNGVFGQQADSQTFLLLLVTQMRNQDPLNPQDPTQFVSQLAQFSSLEQLLGIRQSLGAIETALAPPTTDSSQYPLFLQ